MIFSFLEHAHYCSFLVCVWQKVADGCAVRESDRRTIAMSFTGSKYKAAYSKSKRMEADHGVLVVFGDRPAAFDAFSILVANVESYFAADIFHEVTSLREKFGFIGQGRFGGLHPRRFAGVDN